MNRHKSAGFNLIEMLIAVAIMGIIAAMALPSYQASVLRSGRSEAKSILLQVASNQERFFSANNSYSTNADPLVAPPAATVTSETGLYQVTVAACGGGNIANCFVATATPQNNQANDSCTTITLSNTGVRGATGDTVDECWNR